MRCLVTGAAGFLGSHLCDRLLEHRCEVVGVDSFTDLYSRKIKQSNLENSFNNVKFSFIQENLLSIDLFSVLTGVDYVFHFAAQAGARSSWGRDFRIYNEYNIMATQKLLETLKNFNIKKFVYASSSSVYGSATQLPIHEESILKPSSPCGISKLAAENLVYIYNKRYNVPTLSLRYFTVYGPRQRPDMAFSKFINTILKGEKITVFGDGKQTRDFVYISDVIDATIQAALDDGMTGEVFNIGSGKATSINQAVKQIEKTTKKKAKIDYLYGHEGDVLHTQADIKKAKKMLDYSPKVKFEEGMINEINSIKGK
jgi:UDP-glucose 4-epimerase